MSPFPPAGRPPPPHRVHGALWGFLREPSGIRLRPIRNVTSASWVFRSFDDSNKGHGREGRSRGENGGEGKGREDGEGK
jgi:hypothetical protein